MTGTYLFEERVFASLDAPDLSVRHMNSLPPKLEVRAYDTQPLWEQLIKEIRETRRELSKRLDSIEAILSETRAGLRDAEDRLDKIETKLAK